MTIPVGDASLDATLSVKEVHLLAQHALKTAASPPVTLKCSAKGALAVLVMLTLTVRSAESASISTLTKLSVCVASLVTPVTLHTEVRAGTFWVAGCARNATLLC